MARLVLRSLETVTHEIDPLLGLMVVATKSSVCALSRGGCLMTPVTLPSPKVLPLQYHPPKLNNTESPVNIRIIEKKYGARWSVNHQVFLRVKEVLTSMSCITNTRK